MVLGGGPPAALGDNSTEYRNPGGRKQSKNGHIKVRLRDGRTPAIGNEDLKSIRTHYRTASQRAHAAQPRTAAVARPTSDSSSVRTGRRPGRSSTDSPDAPGPRRGIGWACSA